MPLLAIGQPDGRADLGTRQMLEALEVLLRLRKVAGALVRARYRKLRRCVLRVDLQRFLENRNRLVGILQILVADALEIVRVRILGIKLHSLLKALQRRLQIIARVLREAQVVPGLGALWVQGDCLLQ